MTKPIEDLLPAKPKGRLRIYAYSIEDANHDGMLKIGQTTKSVKSRVEEQLKTALVKHYTVHVDEPAERADGSTFSDHDVRARLAEKGFPKVDLEWMTCSNIDVKVAIAELRTGTAYEGSHHETFPMRPEQSNAVAKACLLYTSPSPRD